MSIQIHKPPSLAEAFQILGEHGQDAKLLAGGTALTLLLQNRLIAPQVLVDLSGVAGLDQIRVDQNGLHVGPMAKLRQVETSPEVLSLWPGLAHAAGVVGNVRVRNQATLGGNLAEADYASDPPAMLLALDATVHVEGPERTRDAPLSEFILGFYTTTLEPDEIIVGIDVPTPSPDARMRYLKYKTRSSEDRPCVGVAVVVQFSGRTCDDLRLAIGAACDAPRRIQTLEEQATNQELADGAIDDLSAAYADAIDTLDDLRGSSWYRKEMIRVHVGRALKAVRDESG